MFMYIAYLGAVFLASIFPLPALYWIARRIAELHYVFDSKGRAAVRDNLSVITNGKLKGKELTAAVRQVYYNFGLYLAEFFRMDHLEHTYLDTRVNIDGIENVDAALEKKHGVVIVSAHYSNWELGLAYLCMSGYPSYVIVAPHKNNKVNELFLRPRINAGARPIDTKEAIEAGYKALRENGILILLADRVTTKGGIPVTFFGRTATFPKGPAKFALRAHAPVVPAHIMRKPDNRFVLTFEEAIHTDAMQDDEESLRALMNAYTRRLEAFIARDPLQYGVFYRIWKGQDKQQEPGK
jgi:KDO2-lipid IV(A) lauroyltransferase